MHKPDCPLFTQAEWDEAADEAAQRTAADAQSAAHAAAAPPSHHGALPNELYLRRGHGADFVVARPGVSNRHTRTFAKADALVRGLRPRPMHGDFVPDGGAGEADSDNGGDDDEVDIIEGDDDEEEEEGEEDFK